MENLIRDGFVKSNADHVRLVMHGRLLRCPLGGNPPGCPLYAIRRQSLAKRFDWIDSKTDQELLLLFEFHVACQEEMLHLFEGVA